MMVLGIAEVWQKEGTRIWVSATRRLKLLIQDVSMDGIYTAMGTGFFFCGCGYRCGSSHNSTAYAALFFTT
jgi:hypothetical protein